MLYNKEEINKNARRLKVLQNLHTHSTFCDGKNSPEEMLQKAISLGFDSLGFSGHAPTVFRDDYEMQDVAGYIKCISELREKYADKIKVFLGVEMDYYSAGMIDTSPFDYKIASVHTSKYRDTALYFDLSASKTREHIDTLFGGDGIAFAKIYYERMAELPRVIDADFIGHFDIVTKFSEKFPELIDTDSKEYRTAALDALCAVKERADFFEVNTGAVGRGHRHTPYPAPFILDEMKSLGAKLLLTSDCHNAEYLDIYFSESREYIKAHGFGELYYLTDKGFVGEKI